MWISSFAVVRKGVPPYFCALIRRQLECFRRDLGYLAAHMAEGYALPANVKVITRIGKRKVSRYKDFKNFLGDGIEK